MTPALVLAAAGYYLDAVKYLEAAERANDMPTLFDLDGAA